MLFNKLTGLVTATTCVLAVGAGAAVADTICVPDDYPTIQAAIAAAVDGDEVCVAPGTYNEQIDYLGKRLRVYSTGGAEVTIIDVASPDDSVVRCVGATEPSAALEGFTITSGDPVDARGGGMHIASSSITISGCRFVGNASLHDGYSKGGGLYVMASTVVLDDCLFEANEVVRDSSSDENAGAGLYAESSTLQINRCTFAGNSAIGGCSASGGGAAFWWDTQATLVDCRFQGNLAYAMNGFCHGETVRTEGRGGGIYARGDVDLIRCEILGNSTAGELGIGSGVLVDLGGTATLINCLLARNRDDASFPGCEFSSAFVADSWEPSTLLNTTVVNNSGVGVFGVGNIAVKNSIIWHNDQAPPFCDPSFSCIEKGAGAGVGVIASDPLFMDPGNDDYRLSPDSLCIDAGDNTALADVDVDLLGNPRFLNDACTEDHGHPNGLRAIVDIGAFEHEPPCPGDLDCDGDIGFTDLLALLATWSVCPGCVGDLDGDGEVGFMELLTVLGNWGPCPEPSACCLPDGSCELVWSLGACIGSGGTYQGDGTRCERVACGAVCFFVAAGSYGEGIDPHAMASGDFDGDSDTDLVVVNRYADSVTVLVNNGSGVFATGATYAGLADPTDVAVGDVNGDHHLDLAVTNDDSNTVSILLNDGTGAFVDAAAYATGERPIAVAMGDLDGDLALDLAVVNYAQSRASILLNTGDGTFADHVMYVHDLHDASSLATGDVDGDGDIDLAVANAVEIGFPPPQSAVRILLNDGGGTFSAGDLVTMLSYPGLTAVGLADLDADTDLDLVVATRDCSGRVFVFPNSGGFFSSTVLKVGRSPSAIAMGDVDGDLDLDLAVTSGFGDVSILLNHGDGMFADDMAHTAGDNPRSVLLADLDGDADLDLAVGNVDDDNVAIFLNDCPSSGP